MVEIITAIIAGAFLVMAARTQAKMNRIHHQVTVNHHSSKDPTVMDLLTDIRDRLDHHIEWHLDHETDKSRTDNEVS